MFLVVRSARTNEAVFRRSSVVHIGTNALFFRAGLSYFSHQTFYRNSLEIRQIEKSVNTPLNSYLPILAAGIADLVDTWRAAISIKKDSRPKLQPDRVAECLRRTQMRGVPALQVALAVLTCEWVFRVRLATDTDTEKVLYEMEAGFCKPLGPILTPFQAHLLINALEPFLRRQMKNAWIPIVLGFDSIEPHPRWDFFPSHVKQEARRKRPARIITKKPGRPPLLGPIIAGLVVEALAEEHLTSGSGAIAKELYRLLLRRDVQGWELKKWRTLLDAIPKEAVSMRIWLRDQMKHAYHQTFEMPGEAMSPERFIEQCKTDPRSVLWWLAQGEILKQVYSVKWG